MDGRVVAHQSQPRPATAATRTTGEPGPESGRLRSAPGPVRPVETADPQAVCGKGRGVGRLRRSQIADCGLWISDSRGTHADNPQSPIRNPQFHRLPTSCLRKHAQENENSRDNSVGQAVVPIPSERSPAFAQNGRSTPRQVGPTTCPTRFCGVEGELRPIQRASGLRDRLQPIGVCRRLWSVAPPLL